MRHYRIQLFSLVFHYISLFQKNSDDRQPKAPSVTTLTELHQSSLDHHRFQFLIAELGMGLTFAAAASRRYEAHNLSSAKLAMAHAEQTYDAMQLSVSRRIKMSDEEGEEITKGLHRLREKLNEVNQRFPKPDF